MMNDITTFRRNTAILAAATILSALALPAGAQARASRWAAWAGCWQSTTNGLSLVEIDNLPTVCVSPTSAPDVVEVATLSKGKVLSRDTIDASGATHTVSAQDCGGTKTAAWSSDQRRVYLKSTITCGSNRTLVSSIVAMNDLGQWLDIRGVSSGDAQNVRVARYRPVPFPDSVRMVVPGELQDQLGSVQGPRLAAGAPVGTAAVIEASKMADSAVVEAWILERNQKFAVNAPLLIQLADAGVPPRVTDAMVAVSNPGEFAIASVDAGTTVKREDDGRRVVFVTAEPMCASSSYALYSPYSYGMSAYDYDRYGCSFSGYRNSYGYGYGYYGSGYGGYRNPPIVIVPGTVVVGNGPTAVAGSGQAVKGRGYTQGGGSAASAPARPASSSGTSSSGTSAAASSSSTQTTQPAQTETRTAKPRP